MILVAIITFLDMLDWVPHSGTGYQMAVTGEHISSSFGYNTASLFWITHCTCCSCRIQHADWA